MIDHQLTVFHLSFAKFPPLLSLVGSTPRGGSLSLSLKGPSILVIYVTNLIVIVIIGIVIVDMAIVVITVIFILFASLEAFRLPTGQIPIFDHA